jgi:hypothetical protein
MRYKVRKHNYPTILLIFVILSISCNLIPLLTEPPTIQISSPSQGEKIVAGTPLEISFLASGSSEIPFVELTLNSINGQSLTSYGSPDAGGQTSLRETLTWTPDGPGEYSLYLTAYDTQGRASNPATVTISVLPQPEIITSGSKVFLDSESFDFVTGEIDEIVGGDLYISQNGPANFSAWANNYTQVGGVFLYNTNNTHYGEVTNLLFEKKNIQKIISDTTQYNFSDAAVPLEVFGLYLYKRHQPPGEYIFFMVTGVADDTVSLDYVVFNLR